MKSSEMAIGNISVGIVVKDFQVWYIENIFIIILWDIKRYGQGNRYDR